MFNTYTSYMADYYGLVLFFRVTLAGKDLSPVHFVSPVRIEFQNVYQDDPYDRSINILSKRRYCV